MDRRPRWPTRPAALAHRPAFLQSPKTHTAALGPLLGVEPAATAAAAVSATAAAAPAAPWSLWQSGEWWMLLAAQSMAIGTVLVPWVSRFVDPVMATGWHMILGAVPLIALAAVREGGELAVRLPELNGAKGGGVGGSGRPAACAGAPIAPRPARPPPPPATPFFQAWTPPY